MCFMNRHDMPRMVADMLPGPCINRDFRVWSLIVFSGRYTMGTDRFCIDFVLEGSRLFSLIDRQGRLAPLPIARPRVVGPTDSEQ